jgi:hypothetical protein
MEYTWWNFTTPSKISGSLPFDRQADLRVPADHAGVNRDELIKMNRELHSYVTTLSGYMLKVRKSDAEAVQAVFDNIKMSLRAASRTVLNQILQNKTFKQLFLYHQSGRHAVRPCGALRCQR